MADQETKSTDLSRIHYKPTEYTLADLLGLHDAYDHHIRAFAAWLEETDRALNLEAVRAYIIDLNASAYSAGTRRIKRQAVISRVRALFRHADPATRTWVEQELADLGKGETKAAKINTTAVGSDKVLSVLEVQKLFEAAPSERVRLYMRFLHATGCRVSEMAGIRLSDCVEQPERVKIKVTGKGNKERAVAVPQALYQAISAEFRGETYLFETKTGGSVSRGQVATAIRKLGKKVLERQLGPHCFRHTFCTDMLRRGVLVDALSTYVGHSSPAITLAMYCHNEMSDSDLFERIAEIAV